VYFVSRRFVDVYGSLFWSLFGLRCRRGEEGEVQAGVGRRKSVLEGTKKFHEPRGGVGVYLRNFLLPVAWATAALDESHSGVVEGGDRLSSHLGYSEFEINVS
jgi:hypothetical protein